MKFPRKAFSGILLAAVLPLVAQTHQARQEDRNTPPSHATRVPDSERGQQVFEQNCSRCHNAPEGFSSSISGTIAMHMRARANLSEADYKALRRFLNP